VVAVNYGAGHSGGFQAETRAAVCHNSVVQNLSGGAAAVSYSVDDLDFKYNTLADNRATNPSNPAVWVNSHPCFNYNNLLANAADWELYNNNLQGTPDLNAENNWWGTRVEAEIQQKIYDWYDDASLGIVDYTPWDTVIRTDCPVSPPTGVRAVPLGNGMAEVSWSRNPEPDLRGYIVHWDTASDTAYPYASHKDVGNETTRVLTGLSRDTYYFTVTAYDQNYDSTRNLPNTVINECQTEGNESWYARGVYTLVTGVGEAAHVVPGELELGCVGSNPFRRGTMVSYALPARTQVELAVYDLSGRKVASLAQGEKQPGRYEARFDASKLPAGVYFCRLRAGDTDRTVKLILQR
jgi:hypothetical protein